MFAACNINLSLGATYQLIYFKTTTKINAQEHKIRIG